MLGAPAPLVEARSASAQSGGFGFTVGGVIDQIIVIDISDNLVKWQPIWTNVLSSPTTWFTDPQWLNHRRHFYRTRSY